jgi:hypothetical protein
MILHRFPLNLEGENGLEAAILEWFGTAEYIIIIIIISSSSISIISISIIITTYYYKCYYKY